MAKRKFLAVFLVIAVIVSLIPMTALAADKDFSYYLKSDGAYHFDQSSVGDFSIYMGWKQYADGQTFALDGDIVLKATPVIQGSVTLLLNGHNISLSDETAINSAFSIERGSLKIIGNGGKVENNKNGVMGCVSMNGGELIAEDTAFSFGKSAYGYGAVTVTSAPAAITIKGGSVAADERAIVDSTTGSQITITGSDIDGLISAGKTTDAPTGKVTINGGTTVNGNLTVRGNAVISGENTAVTGNINVAAAGTLEVSGGVFTDSKIAQYVTNGKAVLADNGSYIVGGEADIAAQAVAKVTEDGTTIYYKSQAEAEAAKEAAQNGGSTVAASYLVTYQDYDGTQLGTEWVEENGTPASVPGDPSREGYEFTGWDKDVTAAITQNTVFTAQYGEKTYTVAVLPAKGGTVTADAAKAKKGDTVTITVSAAEGFALDTIWVTSASGSEITVKPGAGGTYSFTMPEENVTAAAAFKAAEKPQPSGTPEPQPSQTVTPGQSTPPADSGSTQNGAGSTAAAESTPKTGDMNQTGIWLAIAIGALLVLVIAAIIWKIRRANR